MTYINQYINDIKPKDKSAKKTAAIGTGLATLLLGFNPILGAIGFAATGLACLAKHYRNKSYETSIEPMDSYFSKSKAGDLLKFGYNKDKKKKSTEVILPENISFPEEAQDYINELSKNNNNPKYELAIKKMPSGKYNFAKQIRDFGGNMIALPEDFNLIKTHYHIPARQNRQTNSGQNSQNATEQERINALNRIRNGIQANRELDNEVENIINIPV
jgi:hypothetical protein